MSDEVLIRAFSASLFELAAPAEVAADVSNFFVRRGVPAELAGALPESAAERLSIYRQMVQGRLAKAIAEYLPKTAARLGRTRLRAEVERWIAEVSPTTPFFRAVTGDFVAWARGRWADDPMLPAYLLELAQHEWSDAEVGDHPAGGEAASGEPLALDRAVQLDGTTRLCRYAWAVHRAGETGELEREATALLMYRDRDEHRVRTLELTPRAAAVCERLLAGATLQAALTGACEEMQVVLDDEFLAAMASFFADLAERGVLLGAK